MLLLRFAFFDNMLLRFGLLKLTRFYPVGSFVRRVKDDPLSLPPLWANEFSVLVRFDYVTICTSYKSASSKISV